MGCGLRALVPDPSWALVGPVGRGGSGQSHGLSMASGPGACKHEGEGAAHTPPAHLGGGAAWGAGCARWCLTPPGHWWDL